MGLFFTQMPRVIVVVGRIFVAIELWNFIYLACFIDEDLGRYLKFLLGKSFSDLAKKRSAIGSVVLSNKNHRDTEDKELTLN